MYGCRHLLDTMMLLGKLQDNRGQHSFYLFVPVLPKPRSKKGASFAVCRFTIGQAIDLVHDLEQLLGRFRSLDSSH